MDNHEHCPLCGNELKEPIENGALYPQRLLAYWMAKLNEITKALASQDCGDLAVQEQVRRNVETIGNLNSHW